MPTSEDIRFMRLALDQARLAQRLDEVPIGAVLVHSNAVIGTGHNQTLTSQDPTAHAEIVALRQGAQAMGSPRITESTLYVTIEPCVMCVGALVQARIERLVYGAREPKTGAVASAFDVLMSDQHNHRVAITEGVLADETASMMVAFFATRRAQ